MRQHLIRFATVAALAAGMAVAQTAAPAPVPAPGQARTAVRPRARMHQRMMQALNLTDAQKQQAKSIFQQVRQDAQPIRQEVKADDTAQIQALAAKQGSLRGQMLTVRSEAMAKFYSTLTPDQRAKADQMHQQFRQHMQQRFGRTAKNG
jgi:Spy/CpxP family protein refolding chaperone